MKAKTTVSAAALRPSGSSPRSDVRARLIRRGYCTGGAVPVPYGAGPQEAIK